MMLVGALALVVALWAGLVRMGWRWPTAVETWPAFHGPLMVGGFLGTLISLERAVGLGRRWTLVAPALVVLGTLALLTGQASAVAPILLLMGSVALAVVFGAIVRLQPAPFTAMMMAGVLSWGVGNAMWAAGRPFYHVVPWWIGFLTLVIVGERLELSRLVVPPRSARALLVAVAGFLIAAMIASVFNLDAGERAVGLGLIAMALWLFRFDVARLTVRRQGLTRYTAVCMLFGYFWLAVGGLLFLLYGGLRAGLHYDAALHTVFVGFVFAMIFGHALIIVPALLRVQLPYWPGFYFPLALLHLSLALRVGGDLAMAVDARRWGGLLNGAAIVLFLALLAYTAARGRRAVGTPGAERRPSAEQMGR